MQERFFTAAQGNPLTEQQCADIALLREQIVALANIIDVVVPAGRNKSLALSALEDVQMRANRGIFAPEAHR